MEIYDEVSPHKKKSKTASKSNSSKRADHKHDYEKVVLESWIGWKWGGRCKVCGRVDSRPMTYSNSGKDDFLRPEAAKKPGISCRDFLSIQEIREKFPETRIFRFDKQVAHGWETYIEVTEE